MSENGWSLDLPISQIIDRSNKLIESMELEVAPLTMAKINYIIQHGGLSGEIELSDLLSWIEFAYPRLGDSNHVSS